MANNTTLQEILLVTESGFANRPYAERDSGDASKKLSQKEKLIEACWSGLIKELLPEIFSRTPGIEKLFLWQLRECQNILTLELSENRQSIDQALSIDPYHFAYFLANN